MKCSGDVGCGLEFFKDINVGVSDDEILDGDSENFDLLDEELLEEQLLLQYGSMDLEKIGVEFPLGQRVIGSFRKGKSFLFQN